MNKILVTGANGFIGQSLCKELVKKNFFVRGIVRSKLNLNDYKNIEYKTIADINYCTNWTDLLSDIDCVIHCAGKAHVMEKTNIIAEQAYNSINVEGTKQLAMQAANSGVKRMIFLSSIKVNGENTIDSRSDKLNINKHKKIFTHNDNADPKDLYGLSKWNAEKELWGVSAKTNLEINILRLPLVYGKGAKGNLNRLLKLVQSRIPLPFSMIKNERSMIGLDNLINLIILCIDHSGAAGKTFLVSDGEDISTSKLIQYMASSMGRSALLFPIPISILKVSGYILNRSEEVNRLVGSLKVDSSFTREILNWSPQINISEGIRRMVQK